MSSQQEQEEENIQGAGKMWPEDFNPADQQSGGGCTSSSGSESDSDSDGEDQDRPGVVLQPQGDQQEQGGAGEGGDKHPAQGRHASAEPGGSPDERGERGEPGSKYAA